MSEGIQKVMMLRLFSKLSEKYTSANSADSDQIAPEKQSDPGLHYLQYGQYHFEALLNGQILLFQL